MISQAFPKKMEILADNAYFVNREFPDAKMSNNVSAHIPSV